MSERCEFNISCYGRGVEGNPVLSEPVEVVITVYKASEFEVALNVKCIYNTGGHGQRCKASHPEIDKIGDGVTCPYSIDVPYAIDKKIIIRGNQVVDEK